MATTRTTITIDERLLDEIKIRAAEERTTVSALIEQDIRFAEMQHASMANREVKSFVLQTFDLGEPKPGVDLTDNAALLDLMESDE